MLSVPAAHALEAGREVPAPAQPAPSQQPPAQDGVVGILATGCVRKRRVTASAAGFQPRVAPRGSRG